jgi:hypothetical protein
MSKFSDDDVKFLDSFGEFLMKHMHADLTIPQAIQLNKHLAQYNQLRKKVQDSILELRAVHEKPAEAPADAAEKPARSKAK